MYADGVLLEGIKRDFVLSIELLMMLLKSRLLPLENVMIWMFMKKPVRESKLNIL